MSQLLIWTSVKVCPCAFLLRMCFTRERVRTEKQEYPAYDQQGGLENCEHEVIGMHGVIGSAHDIGAGTGSDGEYSKDPAVDLPECLKSEISADKECHEIELTADADAAQDDAD